MAKKAAATELKRLDVGSKVTWTSQAGGNVKTKTGKVVARLGIRETVLSALKAAGIDPTQNISLHGGETSLKERYLVELDAPEKSNGRARSRHFYTPMALTLERQMAKGKGKSAQG